MNAAGCDSSVTTITALLPSAVSNQNITACDSAQVLGIWYFASASLSDTLAGAAANGSGGVTGSWPPTVPSPNCKRAATSGAFCKTNC